MKIANIKFHYKHAFDGKRFERWRDELIADGWTATDPTGFQSGKGGANPTVTLQT